MKQRGLFVSALVLISMSAVLQAAGRSALAAATEKDSRLQSDKLLAEAAVSSIIQALPAK